MAELKYRPCEFKAERKHCTSLGRGSTPACHRYQHLKGWRPSPDPALSLPGPQIDRSTRANSFEVTAAVKWQIWEEPECDPTAPSVIYHRSLPAAFHAAVSSSSYCIKSSRPPPSSGSDCNVPFVTPNLVKRHSGVRACTTFLPLQALKVNFYSGRAQPPQFGFKI